MREALKIYIPAALLAIAGFFVAYQFVQPLPPHMVRMAAGPADGAYAEYARQYRDILADEGVTLEIVPTKGSVENLALLQAPTGGVDVAFLQGGIADRKKVRHLRSLASVFFEPVWLFARKDLRIMRLTGLAGRRVAIGAEGSGTRAIALQLLDANGVGADTSQTLPLGGAEAADALLAGRIDAAFFVMARPSEAMDRLLRTPNVALVGFARAASYTRRFHFLEAVDLPEGVLDLAKDIPPRTVTLLAPAAALVARQDLHPAIVDLLLDAATSVHRAPGLFSGPDQFPSSRYLDLKLSGEARRYLKSGPTLLRRYLPFGWANLANRLAIMLVPLVTLMIPLFRFAPPLYRWRVRGKLLRRYRELRALEAALRAAGAGDAARAELVAKLDRMQESVGALAVPLGYTDSLYHLRLHIDFVRALALRPHGA